MKYAGYNQEAYTQLVKKYPFILEINPEAL